MDLSTRALAFASRWFDPATVHRTFEPLIADWQREWQDTPASRRWRVSVRAIVAFICAVAISSPHIMMTPIPRTIAVPVARRILLFCAIVAGLLSIPLARLFAARSVELSWPATVLLMALPGALVAVFPFSMIIAVDAIGQDETEPPHVKRTVALKLAVCAIMLMFTAEGFVLPFASQAWQRVSTPVGWNVPQATAGESSTLALLTNPERHTAIVPRQYTRAGEIRRVLINRTVASLMPALLVWLRWTMITQPRRRRYWPPPAAALAGLSAGAVILVSFLAGLLEYRLEWQAGTGLWAPVGMLIAWILLERRRGVAAQGR